MINKKWISFSFILLILIFSISVVSAQDNATQTLQEDGNQKNEVKTFENVQIAIDSANENDTVELEGTYLSQGKIINISKSITLKSEKGAILDASQKSTILNITTGNVILKNINFTNSQSDINAAITSNGNLTVENCYFKNNILQFNGVTYSGAGYYNKNPAFNKDHGGAIYSSNRLTVYNSTFENNYANGYEQRIEEGLEDTYYEDIINEYGGGIGSTGYLFITNSTFIDSLITTNQIDSTIVNTTFKKGHKSLYGKSNITLINCNFIQNDGILIQCPKLVIDNCIFINNTRNSSYPNFALIYDCKQAHIFNSYFKNNDRSIIKSDFGNTFVENSNFENNSERTAISGKNIDVKNSTFINNHVYNNVVSGIEGKYIKITNSTFKNNTMCAVISHENITIDGKNYIGEMAFDNSLNETELVKIEVNNTIITYDSGKCPQIYLTFIETGKPVNTFTFTYYLLKSNEFINYNGYSHSIIGKNGSANCEIPDLNVGNYTIKFIKGPFNSYNINKNITFKITKANSNVETENVIVEYGMPITINLKLENATEIKYQLIDTHNNIIKENASKVIDLNDLKLDANTYTLNITTITDENHNEKTITSTVIITKKSSNLIVDVDDSILPDVTTINITGDINGTAIVKIDDNTTKTVNITANTLIPVTFENIPVGKHNVSVILKPTNNNYNESAYNTKFHVFKRQSPIHVISEEKIPEGNILTVNVTIQNATGKVKVNGKEATLVNGKTSIEISDLPLGNNTITVTYEGDDTYNNVSTNITVNVYPKAYANLKATTSDIHIGETAIIYIEIESNITGKVIINGNEINIRDGKATYNIPNLTAGEYNTLVKFTGDKYYKESNVTVTFKVNKLLPTIEIESNEKIVEGNTLIINVTVSNATGKIKVNGKEAMLVNSQASVYVSNLTKRNNRIIVAYEGDDIYHDAIATVDVIVIEIAKEPSIINATIIIDGIEYPTELVNGTAIINTNKPEFKKASEFTEITIGDTQSISIVLKDNEGKVIANAPITYSVNGKANTLSTDKTGKFIINGENGALITIKYAGNENILGENITLKLNNQVVSNVVKVATKFNISNRAITINGHAVDSKVGEQGIYYATTLLDEEGQPISNAYIEFAVNNKIYNRTTYENGSFAPYKLNMIRSGRYTMAFNFAGDDNYTNAFACVCVDLEKKPITINAPAKSYKTSLKTKKYIVSLSTIASIYDGKVYLSPKEVTLTVNGKTYIEKTNKKGKVTFKITNLNKKGKYVANIRVAGDKTYEEATKSAKLTIK